MRTLRAVSSALLLRLVRGVALVGCVVLVPASSAHAQAVPGKEHAKKLFEEGLELEKKADYPAALAKYREAEQITVTPGLRFHKGYCLEMSGKLSAALEEYEAADKLARDANKQDVHAAVVARLEPLRLRVPQIAIRLATGAKDPEVQLDGNPVGAALLDGKAFHLDPGDHSVTARAPGYRSFVRRVQVPESMTTTVEIVLDRAAPDPAAGPAPAPAPASSPPAGVTEPPSEAAPRRSLALPIAATAGAVALVVTGIVLVVVAGNAQSDAKAQCLLKTSCDSEQTTVRTFDALGLGSFIGAAGLGVLSAVLWTSKGSDRAAAALVAKPAFAGGSFGVEGCF